MRYLSRQVLLRFSLKNTGLELDHVLNIRACEDDCCRLPRRGMSLFMVRQLFIEATPPLDADDCYIDEPSSYCRD